MKNRSLRALVLTVVFLSIANPAMSDSCMLSDGSTIQGADGAPCNCPSGTAKVLVSGDSYACGAAIMDPNANVCCRVKESYFCSSCGGSGCGNNAYSTMNKSQCDQFSTAPQDSRYCASSYCN